MIIEMELDEVEDEISMLSISGMTCASCSSSIENDIKNCYGVKDISVNLITGKAIVKYNSSISIRNIINRIENLGFEAKLVNDTHEEKIIDKLDNELSKLRWKLYVCVGCGIIAFIIMILMMVKIGYTIYPGLSISTIISLIIGVFVQVCIGKKHYIEVIKQVKTRVVNMTTLVILSTSLSLCLSIWMLIKNISIGDEVYPMFFDTSVFIFMFVYIGKYLELRGKLWAAKLMSGIVKNDNSKVRVVKDINYLNNYTEIDNSLVCVGDILLIKPGENIVCDGKVLYGETYIDESILTGESTPINKCVGDVVYGGSINVSETICVEAKETGKNMCLNKIRKLVEDAQGMKTSFQNITDKICGWFVYMVLTIALLTFVAWLFVGNNVELPNHFNVITYAVYVSISVIVVACPCALGLATPIAIMVGTGVALKSGILLKNGGETIEKMSKIKTIIFDKTGTLTYGELKIVGIHSVDVVLLEDVYILSCISNHPLSKCIREYSKSFEKNKTVLHEKSYIGKGVECIIDKKRQYLGSMKWLSKEVFEYSDEIDSKLKEYEMLGLSIVVHAIDNKVVNIFGLSDTVKWNAYELINKLKGVDIDVWMISGDNKTTALKIGKQVGIDESKIFAGVLPEDKASIVESIKNVEVYSIWNYFRGQRYVRLDKKLVAMVGDGGNDSIALSRADVGICMRNGSDVALSSADVILMTSNLMDVYYLRMLSRRVMMTIYLNLFWATCYNFIAIPLAAGVFYPMHLNPMCAGLAMSLSSVIVVLNSVLIR